MKSFTPLYHLKQMSSVNVRTLYPGACEPILCRRGHHLHMSKTPKWKGLFT